MQSLIEGDADKATKLSKNINSAIYNSKPFLNSYWHATRLGAGSLGGNWEIGKTKNLQYFFKIDVISYNYM
jgi:hypothetical protein